MLFNQRGVEAINAHKFWSISQGEDIIGAIIDTGCNYTQYPIFKDRVIDTCGFIGQIDKDVTDENGHGTHVCGITLSVAPKMKLLPIRSINKYGVGLTTTEALKFVLNWRGPLGEKVNIVNMSLGTPVNDPFMYDIIKQLYANGIYIFCAQGNEGDGDFGTQEISYPAYYEETFSVACCDYNGNITSFSNSGLESDVSAPGFQINSCYKNGEYQILSGTSMSTPHVTGFAALLMSAFMKKYGDISNIDIQNEIRKRTRQIAKNTYAEGAGMIDASMLLDEFR